MAAGFFADRKLEDAGEQGSSGNQPHHECGCCALVQGADGLARDNHQGDGPEVERYVGIFQQEPVNPGQEPAQQQGQQEGTKQQGKDFAQDGPEGTDKVESLVRNDQRENQGNKQGGDDVGHQGIDGDATGTAPEFVRDDCGRSGCRADEADQCPLKDGVVHRIHRDKQQDERNQRGGGQLEEEQPVVPGTRFEGPQVHFAEGEKELQEDQRRCEQVHKFPDGGFDGIQAVEVVKEEVHGGAGGHGDGQGPFFEETEYLFHGLLGAGLYWVWVS